MNSRYILLIILLSGAFVVSSQTIHRVEPPNWWIGMTDPKLQILVYGDEIGVFDAKTSHKGFKITGVERPTNHNYLIINAKLSKNIKPGVAKIALTKGREKVTEFNFELLVREPGSAERIGHSTKDVIYLITPDRYANGDPNNDMIVGMKELPDRSNKIGRHGGDIEGMRLHLDYISDMGFTAIWPNPVLENDMPRASYHGYATTDFYKVDPRMGSNQDFRTFCSEADQKGIKIIMDMIINHCGSAHWWMDDPPSKDWINYYDQPFTGTNHRKTLQPDLYAAEEDLKILEDGWFVRSMPDLNVKNPWLATYLIQNSIWWIEFAGLHGIRMDTHPYPDDDFMSEWSRRVMTEYPHFNITGEVWHDNPAIISYWQKGKINKNGYSSNLPSLFDFPLQTALYKALMSQDDGDNRWMDLYEMLAQDFQYPDPENLVVFADNHDMVRIFSQLEENIPKLKMALAYILTVRGIPQIYYGTEVLMKSPTTRDDGLVRSDFPGGWNGDEINAFKRTNLTKEQIEIQDYIKRILHWRKNATAIHHGQTTHFVPYDGVYVLFRYDEKQKVMILLNKNENPTTLQLERFKRILGKATIGYDIVHQQKIDLNKEIQLNGPGPMIIDISN